MAEDEPASTLGAQHLDDMLHRRAAGEPLQYVLGSWPFLGHDLFVDPRVLVPRPETEVVAQVAVDEMVRLGARRGRSDPWARPRHHVRRRRLGHRLGCARARAGVGASRRRGVGDRRERRCARRRARQLRRSRIGRGAPARRRRARGSTRFPDQLRGRLRLVVSNPPYVAADEIDTMPREVVDWEPRGALVSGPTGVEAIEQIVDEAPAWLDPARQRARVRACPAPGRGDDGACARDRDSSTCRSAPTSPAAIGCSSPASLGSVWLDGRRARRRRDARPVPRTRRGGARPSAAAGRRPGAPEVRRAGPARLPRLRHGRRRHLGVRRRRPHAAHRSGIARREAEPKICAMLSIERGSRSS